MNNIADLKDPNDKQGRTYRQINNSVCHGIGLGVLVELDTGVRLFVAKHTRDCDGTPLYVLTSEIQGEYPLNQMNWLHGYSDNILRAVK
jgi:hypothetical protein